MLGWVLVYDWMKRVKTRFFFLFKACGCMRFLVTGGAGFIGGHIADRLSLRVTDSSIVTGRPRVLDLIIDYFPCNRILFKQEFIINRINVEQ